MQPRMEEILTMVREKIDGMGYLPHIGGGIVLTGGCAKTPGVAELANQVFRMPVRIGLPLSVGGLVDEFKSPEYATSVGLVLSGLADAGSAARAPKGRVKKVESGAINRLADWFRREFF
jgi:cell division protein FtsA